ncbi:FAD-dependent monooxygenase [Haliscomenobacter sp.]|uniref:FAD-dependent monooxygenase n=1 Tax=Haliscomenobacter sp. TaxID=2717303 RepID=UPI0035934AAD
MKINIIGAGIGGLTAAIALEKKGHQVELYEAAAALRPIGAGIIMASNAMQIARRLAFADEIAQAGYVLDRFGIADHLGRPLQIMDIQAIRAKFGEPSVAIHRGQLQQILLQHLPNTPIHVNKRLQSIQQLPGGKVVAFFKDGSQSESDVLVGADGLRSATRKAIFGEKPLRYSSHTCWRGIIQHQFKNPNQAQELWAKTGGKRVAMIQVAADKVYFYYTEKRKPGFNLPQADQLSYLQEQFSEFPTMYAEVIAKAKPAEIFHDDLYDLKPLWKWHQNRVILLGDAAHATTPNMGQGGCQAIEDAWYLAEYLERYDTIAEAFAAYEQFRRPKVNFVVNTSFMIGKMSNLGGELGHRLRNWVLSATPKKMAEQQLEALFRLQ